jgi:hypothetical protein
MPSISEWDEDETTFVHLFVGEGFSGVRKSQAIWTKRAWLSLNF